MTPELDETNSQFSLVVRITLAIYRHEGDEDFLRNLASCFSVRQLRSAGDFATVQLRREQQTNSLDFGQRWSFVQNDATVRTFSVRPERF